MSAHLYVDNSVGLNQQQTVNTHFQPDAIKEVTTVVCVNEGKNSIQEEKT